MTLARQIDEMMARLGAGFGPDRVVLRRRLRGVERAARERRRIDRPLEAIADEIERSIQRRAARAARVPAITFPPELPITGQLDRIAEALNAHQVVVVCGETGSGKTTQLPKLCLKLGRGIGGLIGHTQPRRIAARAMANRLSHELGSPPGRDVGFKIRFTDSTGPDAYIKVMTDGILLAEIQGDRTLEQYDTLIIDEAHERSLNIDFLLGCIKQVLPRRPDLKVIITSATIDPKRFSEHFGGAPVIEVSGRTYPVEVLYRPVESDEPDDGETRKPSRGQAERDMQAAILHAADELLFIDSQRGGTGDVLVFLSGEREIRDTAEALRKHPPLQRDTEILPLYARLSADAQQRVFAPRAPGIRRRFVLSTNVAETSLTVPGVRYVIDPGMARFSRYNPRTKVQRLPIEPVSQASADQRKGRCGRVADGVCIRLYSEEDFAEREPFTPPEILRTDLASAILQMKALGLGEVEAFPFMDRPDDRLVRDGYRTLIELGAIDLEDPQRRLTDIGRQMARLPIDPRTARMILAASAEGCLTQVLVIAAALSIQDPRERPIEEADKADEAQASWRDPTSDFLGFLKLWEVYHQKSREISRSQLRKWCKEHYLSAVRMREWLDVHSQLRELVAELMASAASQPSLSSGERAGVRGNRGSTRDTRFAKSPSANSGGNQRNQRFSNTRNPPSHGLAQETGLATLSPLERARAARTANLPRLAEDPRHDAIHRALLTGLLSNVGTKGETHEYTGARGVKFHLFPGSVLFDKKPAWVMAAELVETARLYARTVAQVRPEWIEAAAPHLVERSYSDPIWDRVSAHVRAFERVTLFGLAIVPKRRVHFGPIDPVVSREVFIDHALVQGEFRTDAPFLLHNLGLVDQIRRLEDKARRRDLLADNSQRIAFYDLLVPEGIHNGPAFERWRHHAERDNPKLLFMQPGHVMTPDAAGITAAHFPDELAVDGLIIALSYRFDPGGPSDGITATIPLAALMQLPAARFEWLVPGLLKDKCIALIRGLPKAVRVAFVGAARFAEAAMERMRFGEGSLLDALANELGKLTGQPIARSDWHPSELPEHLRMNFRVIDESGRQIANGRDLEEIRGRLRASASEVFARMKDSPFHRDGVTKWDFGDLPESVEVRHQGMTLRGYPGVIDHESSVSLRLFDSADRAAEATRSGVRRLFMLHLKDELHSMARLLPRETLDRMAVAFSPLGARADLERGLMEAITDRVFLGAPTGLPAVRTAMEFELRVRGHWHRLSESAREIIALLAPILDAYGRVALALDRKTPLLLEPAVVDVREQLAALMPRDFLTHTSYEWLRHYPRFLGAIEARLRKLYHAGLDRDTRSMSQVTPWWLALQLRQRDHAAAGVRDLELERFRWLLEEFRVALFAQEMGTSLPVSLKRIEEQWGRVRRV